MQHKDNKGDATLVNAINILVNTPVSTTRTDPSGQEGEGDDLKIGSHGQDFPKLPPVIDAEVEEVP